MSSQMTFEDLPSATFSRGSVGLGWPSGSRGGPTTCHSGRADSPARTSPRRARGRGSRASDPACGGSFFDLLTPVGRHGCSLRTSLLSELAELTTCSLRWRESATPAGRSWWVLGRSERSTSETASGSWPTATSSGFEAADLDRLLERREQCKKTARNGNGFGLTINQAVRLHEAGMWPTPATRDWKDKGSEPAAQARKSPCLPAAAHLAGQRDQANPSTDGKPQGSLNSRWVAQLMGYPSDWCDVPTSSN